VHIEVAVVAARAYDVNSVEAIVKADYACVSGGVGVARQSARDFIQYDPYARSFVANMRWLKRSTGMGCGDGL
jgi:hypothetical protein